ncbi:hypothetical protein ACFX2C_009131 [Malus domestica]
MAVLQADEWNSANRAGSNLDLGSMKAVPSHLSQNENLSDTTHLLFFVSPLRTNKLSKKNYLVTLQAVNDEVHEVTDLNLILVRLSGRCG